METPGRLDRALHRLGAGVAEEHSIGKGQCAEPLSQTHLIGNVVQVGDMPEPRRLIGQRRDQMRVAVAQRVDRDPGREIEISAPVRIEQISAFTLFERNGWVTVCRHHRIHDLIPSTT